MFYVKSKDGKVLQMITCDTLKQAEEYMKPNYAEGEQLFGNEVENNMEIQWLISENYKQIQQVRDKQIFGLENTVGKTVKLVYDSYKEEAVAYTDGTFRIIKTRHEYDEDWSIDDEPVKENIIILLQLELITHDQFDRYHYEKQEREKAIRYQAEEREFQRLKKKLGK